MKLIKNFINFLEAFLFVIIVPLMFYWTLSLIDSPIIAPMKAFLGIFYNTGLSIVRLLFPTTIPIDGINYDFSYLILAISFVIVSLALTFIRKTIDYLENKAFELKKITKEKQNEKKQEDKLQKFATDLNQNKIIYLKISLDVGEDKSSYLYKNAETPQLNTNFSQLIEHLKKFNTKLHSTNNNVFNVIFYDIDEVTTYLQDTLKALTKIDEKFSSIGMKLSIKFAIDCYYDEVSADNIFDSLENIKNLAGNNEIISTELFKNKYDLSTGNTISFESKGIYMLNEKQTELFKITIVK